MEGALTELSRGLASSQAGPCNESLFWVAIATGYPGQSPFLLISVTKGQGWKAKLQD